MKKALNLSLLVILTFSGLASCSRQTPALDAPTPTPTTIPYGPTATPDACVAFDLTPEECANSGLHTYLWTGEILNNIEGCGWSTAISGEVSHTVIFVREYSPGREYSPFRDSVQFSTWNLTANKISDNTYSYTSQTGSAGIWTSTITFRLNGFIIESTSPRWSCVYKYTYAFK